MKSHHPNARPHFLCTFVVTALFVVAFVIGKARAAEPEKLDATVAGVTVYQAQIPTETTAIVSPDMADAADATMKALNALLSKEQAQ